MSDTVVRYFWAPWCSSCVTVGPMLEKLCAERGVTLEKFDADVHPLPDALINYTSLPVVQIKSKTVDLAFAGASARTYAAAIRQAKAEGWDERDGAEPSYLGPDQGHYPDCCGWEDCYCASYPNPYRTESEGAW